VQVRVLLDAFGAMKAPDDDFEKLESAGAVVAKFRPAVLGKLLRFHRRNHRRAIVIDGCVAFTGGAAVGDKWLGDARNPDEWRDSMVRVDGCLAHKLQSAFCELWAFCTGAVLTGHNLIPPDLVDDRDSSVRSCGVIASPSS
jgi:cardiolipin synthase